MSSDANSAAPAAAPEAEADAAPGYELILRPETSWLAIELKGIWRYRDLVWLLVWRDFVSKYRQTILGPLWFIVQPVLLTVVFTIIFGKVAKLPTEGVPPMLFYLCGQLGWNYFAQNFAANSGSLVTNAALFSKVYFPRLVVPLSAVISNLLAFAIQTVTFFAFFLFYKFALHATGFGLDWRVVFLPLLVLQAALLSLAVGLLMSAMTAKYRDLTHLSPLIIQIWMYATPVIFPLSKFPLKWQWVVALNPMTSIVESFRLALLGTGTVEPSQLLVSILLTLGMLLAGLVLFGKVEKSFIDTV